MKDQRDEQLKALLPQLTIDTERSTPAEKYQGETLRPVLKFQNDFILRSFSNYLTEKKVLWEEMKEETKMEMIHAILKKDQSYKQLIIGSMTGFFTAAELDFYFNNKAEINKRITELAIKRISDQYLLIKRNV